MAKTGARLIKERLAYTDKPQLYLNFYKCPNRNLAMNNHMTHWYENWYHTDCMWL